MFLASRIGWAGIGLTLLTTGMLVELFPRSASGSDSNQEEAVVAFVIKNEIVKMQETLRNKGHHRGKVDGVLGLQTRESIREYQKAENLPATGQVDSRTADGLGIRPESSWFQSESAGHGSDRAGSEIKKDKPSAGIQWTESTRRTGKTLRQAGKADAAPESGRGDRAKKLPAENENHPR